MGLYLCQQRGKFVSVKLPLKRSGTLVGKFFILRQPESYLLQVGEIIGCQHLALDDRKVDFYLIEPTGVDRGMHQDDPGIDLIQSLLGGLPTVRGAIVHDPEKARCGAIRFLGHYLVYQSTEGFDPSLRFAASHHLAPANIPSCQILQCPATLVLILDASRLARLRRPGWMAAEAGLDAGFLISANDEFIWF